MCNVKLKLILYVTSIQFDKLDSYNSDQRDLYWDWMAKIFHLRVQPPQL